MKFRRYYLRGVSYDRVMSDKQFEEIKDRDGIDVAMMQDNAHYDIKFDNDNEMIEYFNDSCLRIMNDTRWYLDNLDKVPTFQVEKRKVYKVNQRSI